VKAITFHPDAEAEITDAARHYEDRSPGLGSGLLGGVERALSPNLRKSAQSVDRPSGLKEKRSSADFAD